MKNCVAEEDNPISFLEFPLLRPPLSPELARQHAIPFVGSVHEAITELHDQFKIAHLDIKLGNICIDGAPGTFVAKLIDLDRSQNAGKPFLKSNVFKYTSVMYKGKKDWTLGQLDWRKLGIVIFGFLNNTPSVSYHSSEPKPNSGFLNGLVDNGIFNQDLFLKWDPEVDIIN